jgi:mono/diheme cytochrome c family protein
MLLRLVLAFSQLVFLLTLTACGGDSASSSDSANNQRSASETQALENTEDEPLPLLEMGVKLAPLAAGCENQPDDTPVPLDPRSLVVEGVNKPDTAIQFNAYWIDVHKPLPPFKPNPLQKAETCGQWRAQVAEGQEYIQKTSVFMGGTRLFTARIFRDIWKSWGVSERPANFDDEVLKRYGLFAADFRNPYPLEGEDPNLTDGGSGQLPLGLSMVKNRDDQYTGELTINCSFCHDSRVGTDEEGQQFHWGRGSNYFDIGVFVNDSTKRLIGIPAIVPFPFGSNAGVSNALGVIDALFLAFDAETLSISPGVEFFPSHGSEGQVKAPNWWSRAWMTRLFHGALSSDNVRSTMALSVANFMMTGAERRAMEPTFEGVDAFLNSLSAPAYPYPELIDIPLAEAGAVLFHTRDLWANDANSHIPKAAGNGSCASCHGVYSPRFAADPSMLPDRRLKGVAGVTTPIETIRTDPERTNVMSAPMKVAWNTSWWAYDDLHPEWTREGQGRAGTTLARLQNDLAGGGQRLEGPNVWSDIVGYNAPPLYGVWAAAPYFHNGSVPTVWGILKPSDRPNIWQPPLTEPAAEGLNAGFDYSLNAYDLDNLGWKYTEIPCTEGTEKWNCNPTNSLDKFFSWLSNKLGDQYWLAYQTMPPFTKKDMEARRIVNTHEFSRGNEGHDFTEVLSDAERYALLEYLKTL